MTTIEWTDRTWNPVRGCSRVSDGCRFCYAERQAVRQKNGAFRGLVESTPAGPRWTGAVRLVPEHLADPLKWRKPRRIFVNSMSDLFHEALSDADIDRVFAVMALAPQHTFQVLTKRPERMREYMNRLAKFPDGLSHLTNAAKADGRHIYRLAWPLPNVWLGVSVEDQATADARIPHLLATPAAVRFVSYEPALGPVDFKVAPVSQWPDGSRWMPNAKEWDDWKYWMHRDHGIDWLIVGGESGPGARPCDVAWLRSAVAQCKAAGVPVFVKQMGARPFERHDRECTGRFVDAPLRLRDRKGGDIREWPEDLRVREFPHA